ncbi:hypothetical protein [Acetivibrio clariflavus]|uniref:Uncharacterized protein n=1 Tax=Acetivibrio clariflavus (strain DSM 19732 / NBRC 101661 / EBR45) TaxID=720554 RepID=G8LY36_ACECE|nr:hypothetical protein [Acetivibrio clariflavus]AEV67767.1 hypothetical protein Clocl_1092 [Acetivibrio clariflavus DSM 19732]
MIQINEEKFYTLLKFFFSQFFCDDLEKAIEDENEEVSVVTLFKGMEFFFDLVKEYNIDFPYSTIREYIINTYSDGESVYEKLAEKYHREIEIYQPKDKSFEEIFGDTQFI